MKILIVEDEKELQSAIAEGLKLEGYIVDTCDDGLEATKICSSEIYDLVILDLNLPGIDGFEVLNYIRSFNQEVKILILSARNAIQDKVNGLDYGANDYLTKPFAFEELEARIRNLLRRSFIQQNNILSFDALKMDIFQRKVSINDKNIEITKKEFLILQYFLMNPQKVISQEELIEHVWDRNANSFSGAIRVHIASLRKKIRNVLGVDLIQTKVGVGYYLKGVNNNVE